MTQNPSPGCRLRARLFSLPLCLLAVLAVLADPGTHSGAASAGEASAKPAAVPQLFQPARLTVEPTALRLDSSSSSHGLLVTGWAKGGTPGRGSESTGDRVDLTGHSLYESGDPGVVSVTAGGECRAVHNGRTEIVVRHGGKLARVPVEVNGLDPAHVPAPSFRQEVLPILTRTGCNMGACHGKLAGQNGFKLSLRGYAPEQDFYSLTTDLGGRRVNPTAPDESLLLLKALARVPHEGRQRFEEGSIYRERLAAWVAARCPGPDTNETDAVALEILPGARTLRLGETQQLLVRARYADGQTRDVTWLAQFFSNDGNTLSVTPGGLARAVRHGETSVRAHFQGQVEAIVLTIPYENKVAPREFARQNSILDAPLLARLRALRSPRPRSATTRPSCAGPRWMRPAPCRLRPKWRRS